MTEVHILSEGILPWGDFLSDRLLGGSPPAQQGFERSSFSEKEYAGPLSKNSIDRINNTSG
jgi:hypothetical protein